MWTNSVGKKTTGEKIKRKLTEDEIKTQRKKSGGNGEEGDRDKKINGGKTLIKC